MYGGSGEEIGEKIGEACTEGIEVEDGNMRQW